MPDPVPDETVEAVAKALRQRYFEVQRRVQGEPTFGEYAEAAIAALRATEKPGLTAEECKWLRSRLFPRTSNGYDALMAAQVWPKLRTFAQEPDRG